MSVLCRSVHEILHSGAVLQFPYAVQTFRLCIITKWTVLSGGPRQGKEFSHVHNPFKRKKDNELSWPYMRQAKQILNRHTHFVPDLKSLLNFEGRSLKRKLSFWLPSYVERFSFPNLLIFLGWQLKSFGILFAFKAMQNSEIDKKNDHKITRHIWVLKVKTIMRISL